MLKYLLFFCLIFSASILQAKVEKKETVENQKYREALLIEQKRLLDEITNLQQNLHGLKTLQQEKQTTLSKDKQEVAKGLPLLVHLGRVNPLRLLIDPLTGQKTLRGIILVRAITDSLKRQMKQIQAELNEIQTISKDLEGQEQAQLKLLQAVELQKIQLQELEGNTLENIKQKELARLADEEDINTLLDESRAALSKTERAANEASSSKKLPFRRLERPVPGKIVDAKAAKNKFSPQSIGIIFETEKNAEVLSPSSGTIVFKGPFRDQGDILILDHGQNVHSVFMGMDKINAYVGQKVYAREKLGTMAGYGSGSPQLYFELRQKGKAIDSKPFFADKK